MAGRSYSWVLGALLGTSAVARIAYVLAQPTFDPAFSRPMLDGALYIRWARGMVAGAGSPAGAYYLAPLYPITLAVFFKLIGERLGVLYTAQHLAILAAAGALSSVARRTAGDLAGLSAAAMVILYHPSVFFASIPMGEALAVLLLAASVWLAHYYNCYNTGRGIWLLAAGLLAGLSALVRPNLLLVAVLWALLEGIRRRPVAAGLLALGAAIAILPVAARNFAASGHFVPVSSNAGITLYHGNGPGAEGGFTLPAGFTGSVATQQQEATEIARARTGHDLDPVEADLWWGREAARVRSQHPLETLWLVARKTLLLLDNAEHGLDYAPSLDADPWRWAAPLPFAAIAGLAAAGIAALGIRRTGGYLIWSSIVACAAMPVVFYTSSRYRLPATLLLCVPAGCGVVALVGVRAAPVRRRACAAAVGAAVVVISLAVPSADLARAETSGALSNRAAAYKQVGDLESAQRDARRAIEIDPTSVAPRFNLGAVLEARGFAHEAEAAYASAIAIDPANADVAANLAALLLRRGAPRDAIPILERALRFRPGHEGCQTNLVVALVAAGDAVGARRAADAAARAGVTLDPGLLGELR